MTRKGDWIQTYTGKQSWPIDARSEDTGIEDIAHALSNLCRYGGHCKRFYSVAEHSVLVSRFVSPHNAMNGLLHDAAEVYLVDVPRPIKSHLQGYKDIENRLLDVIFEYAGCTKSSLAEIKKIDTAILADEKIQAMGRPPADWGLTEPSLGVEIRFWNPREAKLRFLERYADFKEG